MDQRNRWRRDRGARLRALGVCIPRAVWLLWGLMLSRGAQAQELTPAAPSVVAERLAAPERSVVLERSAVQRETARAWVLEGRRLFAAQDYAAALERYAAAYQLVRAPTVGIEVARAQQALGKWVEANATAVEVINLPSSEAEPAVFGQARDAARQLLRSLTPRIPALQLEISPAAIDIEVAIDGEPMPFASGAMPFRLNPGTHEVQVHAPGFHAERRMVTLSEQEARVLSFVLLAEQPPTLVPAGEPAGSALAGVMAGDAGAGARTRGYVALSAAGAAALLGSVTGVLAFSSKPDCARDICAAELRDEAERSRSFGNVATVSFGVALVAVAYGGWELLLNARSDSGGRANTPVLRAGVVAQGRGAALQLAGAF